jgi:hypothetical protein
METGSRSIKHDSFKRFDFTGAAKGGCPEQQSGRVLDSSNNVFRQPAETMTDQQSFGCMEERYGIREEGIF